MSSLLIQNQNNPHQKKIQSPCSNVFFLLFLLFLFSLCELFLSFVVAFPNGHFFLQPLERSRLCEILVNLHVLRNSFQVASKEWLGRQGSCKEVERKAYESTPLSSTSRSTIHKGPLIIQLFTEPCPCLVCLLKFPWLSFPPTSFPSSLLQQCTTHPDLDHPLDSV